MGALKPLLLNQDGSINSSRINLRDETTKVFEKASHKVEELRVILIQNITGINSLGDPPFEIYSLRIYKYH